MSLRCHDFNGIPLISHAGSTTYFPARVMRQHGCLQTVLEDTARTRFENTWWKDQTPVDRQSDIEQVQEEEEVVPTLAGAPSAYSGALLPQVPPLVVQVSSTLDEHARITTLKNMVNMMATNMVELMTALRNQKHASSSSNLPPEDVNTPAPLMTHALTTEPANAFTPSPLAPAAVQLSPIAFLAPDQAISVPLPMSIPTPAPIYTAPLPMVTPASMAFAPAHTAESFLHQTPQSNIGLPHQAPPPINITFPELGTSIHAAPTAPPTNFLPEGETEQERRIKKLEEMIKALQVKESRFNASFSNWSLFPNMRLPPKIMIPEFQRYEGTKDLQHHLRYYQGKMRPYWDYEEFVIHTF
ncbi:hypothetical protein CRG98_030159 [Punica granatum]|uniref:Uncharacterized protein n=1 Tax=Punica granatum TaxID=22663 RepID=A0A2I0IZJ6_PUNGR|nr:hypothetical protein CRG98_030159 [Punica granatum]